MINHWLVFVSMGIASLLSHEAACQDEVSDEMIAWCEGYGSAPTYEDLGSLLAHNRGYVANPDHAAWLGVMYLRGVPGFFGADEERGDELIGYAASHGQPLALLWVLNDAINERDDQEVQRILQEGWDGPSADLADRLKASSLIAEVLGLAGDDPARAEQELVDWYLESSNVSAAIQLYNFRDHLSSERTGLDFDALLEHLRLSNTIFGLVGTARLLESEAIRLGTSEANQRARQAWSEAAQAGVGYAMAHMAFGLWDGSGVFQKDREQAIYWLAHVAYHDTAAAMLLARSWLTGVGCEPNREAAIALLDRYGRLDHGGLWVGPDADAIRTILVAGRPNYDPGDEADD